MSVTELPQTLICSAFVPELSHILATLGAAPDSDSAYGTVGTHAVIAAPLGIGVVAATARLIELLQQHPSIQRVIFIGTAGSSDPVILPIGTLVRTARCVLLDADICTGAAYLPAPMTDAIECTPWLASAPALPTAPLLTPIGITHAADRAARLHAHFGACIENLEGYAVAWVCQQRQLACDIWCAISNQLGPDGHEQWQTHHHTVSAALQTRLIDALAHLA